VQNNQQQVIDVIKLWTELTGKPYVPSWETDIRKTFNRVTGWTTAKERNKNAAA
jgi:hypothetical protein